jgi:uncharacterized protein YuzE
MRFEYDQTADALYVRLVEGAMVAGTVEVDRGTLVDVDESGQALGIEIIRPSRPVPVEEIADRFDLDSEQRGALVGIWGPRLSQEPADLVAS